MSSLEPTYTFNPDPAKPAIYSPRVVLSFSILFSALAGGILTFYSLRAAGQPVGGRRALWASIGYVAVLLALVSALPLRGGGTGLSVGFGYVGGYVLNHFFLEKYLPDEASYPRKGVGEAADYLGSGFRSGAVWNSVVVSVGRRRTVGMPAEFTLPLLCLAALLAGLIDGMVGGGGLIQLPALLLLLPHSPVPTALGTGKVASLAGTSASAYRYLRGLTGVSIRWRTVAVAALVAGGFALLGARAVSGLDKNLVKPLVLALLVLMAAYTAWRKDFGSLHAPRLHGSRELWTGVALGAGLGFYDGFFGPGTGSLLLFAFVGLFGYDFLARLGLGQGRVTLPPTWRGWPTSSPLGRCCGTLPCPWPCATCWARCWGRGWRCSAARASCGGCFWWWSAALFSS